MTALYIETKYTNVFILLTCVFEISSNKNKTDYKSIDDIYCKKPFPGQLPPVGGIPRPNRIRHSPVLRFKNTY